MKSEKSNSLKYFSHLIRYSFKSMPILYLVIFLSLFSVVIELTAMNALVPLFSLSSNNSILISGIYTKILHHIGVPFNVKTLLLMFIFLLILRFLTMLASQGISAKTCKTLQAQMSAKALEQVLSNYSVEEIEDKSIGHFITLAGDETARASNILLTFTHFISGFFLAVLYYVAIVHFSNLAALGVAIFLAISAIGLNQIFRFTHKVGINQIEQGRIVHSIFLDALNGFRSVRAFGAQEFLSLKHKNAVYKYMHLQFISDFLSIIARLVPILLFLLCFYVFIQLGILNTNDKKNFPFIITILVFMIRFFPAVGNSLNLFLKMLTDIKAAQDITDVINYKRRSSEGSVIALDEPIEIIDLKNVSFSYHKNNRILNHISIAFEKGKSYALIGPSGIGKSTLLDIILKFRDPDEGEIYINKKNIQDIQTESLRKKILLLGQKSTFLNDSILNNILFGNENIDDGVVEKACNLVYLSEVINNLSHGYQTILSYQGNNLSGGQLQRLALARALVRNPEVLILDESTSALDVSTRNLVVENLLSIQKKGIIIFVTHDHTIARKVDFVVNIQAMNETLPSSIKQTARNFSQI